VLWEELNGHWGYEDDFYRFYHGSFKVYRVQSLTEKAVKFLRELLPEREPNETYMAIIREGTGN
jgi:isocitrate dehydrogenase kinase/phosphatase